MSDERPIDPNDAYARAAERFASESPREPVTPRPPRAGRHSKTKPARPPRTPRGDAGVVPVRGPRPGRVPRVPKSSRPVGAGRLPSSGSAMRRRLVIALAVLALIIAGVAYGVWSTLYRVTAVVPAGKSVEVTIAPGMSGEKVAQMLAGLGVIDNPTMFRWRVSQLEAAGEIKAGSYTLETGSKYDDVIAVLTHGPEIAYTTVTIPEGWGIEKTAARVEEKLGIPASEFVALATTGAKGFNFGFLADNPTPTLEGYLFPKTYDFKPGVTATDVIQTMLAQYNEEVAGIDYSFARSKGLTAHDVLTIASIIEREARLQEDRPDVASVIYNRLKIGMRLQVDPTVQYALDGKVELTLDDLKTEHPYNTYFIKGLPPGPICSPGISAIAAAAQPTETKNLYYILTHKDGSLSFATNYDDFLVLKAQYKRGLK